MELKNSIYTVVWLSLFNICASWVLQRDNNSTPLASREDKLKVKSWDECLKSGRKLYEELKFFKEAQKHTDKEGTDPDYKSFTPVQKSHQPITDSIADLWEPLNLPLKDYHKIQLQRETSTPGPKLKPIFENLFSVKEGVIIAMYNFRDDLVNDPNIGSKGLHWSDAIWEGYHDLANSQNPKTSLTNLKFIVQFEVVNAATHLVVDEAYRRIGLEVPDKTPRAWREWLYSAHPDEFLAILGTPNGVGQARLLIDHANSFGYKAIEKILTYNGRKKTGKYSMYIAFQLFKS